MSRRGASPDPRDVLVGVVKTKRDLQTVCDEGWYRIPVASKPRGPWPPRWLAFYESQGTGGPEGAIRRFAEVRGRKECTREELFPGEPSRAKAGTLYYRFELGPLQELAAPITLDRQRSIAFIHTTLNRLQNADSINDLYSDSYLEDVLWAEFKSRELPAERQWREKTSAGSFMLDFAMFCDKGKIDVETDGDSYHANSEASVRDNARNNELEVRGWRVLRFNTPDITGRIGYCLDKILSMVNVLGGFENDGIVPRRWIGRDTFQTSFMEERQEWDSGAGCG